MQREAVTAAGTALAHLDLAQAERLQLLDLRAESLLAVGDFGAAMADAQAMQALARSAGDGTAKARVLCRLSGVQARLGDESDAARSARAALAAARRADDAGLQALVASQPPEETIELLNTYYTLMFDAISSQGGVVIQMVGVGLMAVFGAPLPLAGHSEADLRATLEMAEMVEIFSAEGEAAGKPAVRIGIGIANGLVVAGYTGTQRRATYTCVGDAVNLAARLEAHTKEAGRTILIDGVARGALGGGWTRWARCR